MKRWEWTVAAILLCVAIIVLPGCGKVAEEVAETATGVEVNQEGDSVTVKTDEGETTASTSNELPDGFPKEVPVYENAKIESSFVGEADGEKSFTVSLRTDDTVDDVADWYEAQMQDEGWTNTGTMEADGLASISAEKGDLQFSATVTAETDTNTTLIALIAAPKQ